MTTNLQKMIDRKRQQGAVLIVGLLLLVVITILAVSGMNTATTELAMARNDQAYENAFQAAETGIENALAQDVFNTGGVPTPIPIPQTTYEKVTVEIQYEDSTLVPDQAFSLGSGTGIAAYHFNATSEAEYIISLGNDRNARAVHTQAFYIVGPDSPTL